MKGSVFPLGCNGADFEGGKCEQINFDMFTAINNVMNCVPFQAPETFRINQFVYSRRTSHDVATRAAREAAYK